MSLRAVIWLGPIVFLVHDLEEVFRTRPWVDANQVLIESTPFQPVVQAMGYEPAKFGLVVALVTVLYFVISYFATRHVRPGVSMNLYAATVLTMCVNVVTHVGQSVLLRMYTPGVITAVLVVLPYTVIALRKLRAHRLLTASTWIASPLLIAGMFAAIFGLMVAL